MLLKPLRALIQFTTIIPVGKTADFTSFSRRSWIYPLAGYLIGALAAIGIFWIENPLLAAAGAVSLLLLITGVHHFDGLLDLGDGLMAHGNREKRRIALTDRQIGAGGVALGASTLLITFASLASLETLWAAIIVAEVAAKFSMAFLTAYGTPFREGVHSVLHAEARLWFPVLSALLCVPLILLPVAPIRLAGAALVMLIVPTFILVLSNHLFGGVNGDVVGASNELTRALVLAVMAVIPVSALF